ncbi:tyrosine-type recombinase/integrase [Parasphingorhabdus flavimaris]|uniref:tyrosine-type recombinase/integrase n=1 Tax=Parasphingorhabdus flavimaris TaxID=266812 RepID=UPI0030012AAC
MFVDALSQLDPSYARSPNHRALNWKELQDIFGYSKNGISDRTLNRHMATLKSLWAWAHDREYCEGNNPFAGFHRKIVEGRNSAGYKPWQDSELKLIWSKPPKRKDLQEVMAVAMYTGMRLDEIASLTWEQIKRDDEIDYIEVQGAKTGAGNRPVPLHAALSWLPKRKPKSGTGRVWPKFNPEGPAKKAGADAGNDFSRYKIGLGFSDRTKTFHSFRKTVTKQMERAGVRENEWAEIIGHEKGFTFKTYNPDGLALSHKAAIIAKIVYPNLKLPRF